MHVSYRAESSLNYYEIINGPNPSINSRKSQFTLPTTSKSDEVVILYLTQCTQNFVSKRRFNNPEATKIIKQSRSKRIALRCVSTKTLRMPRNPKLTMASSTNVAVRKNILCNEKVKISVQIAFVSSHIAF